MADAFDYPNLPQERRLELIAQVKAAMPWLETVLQMKDFTKRRIGDDVVYYFHSRRSEKPLPITFDILQGMVDGRSKLKWWSWCVNNTGGLFPPAAMGTSDFQDLLRIANVTEVVEEGDTQFQEMLYLYVSAYDVYDTEADAIAGRKTLREWRTIVTSDTNYKTCGVAADTRRAYVTLPIFEAWLKSLHQSFKHSQIPKYLRESGWEMKKRNWGNYWQSPVDFGPIADMKRDMTENA